MPKVSTKPKCGLCGERRRGIKVVRTECCNNWICDDERTYRPFSFAFNSCRRNHRRYSLCAFHFTEGHEGRWQDCKECNDLGGDEFPFKFTCVNCEATADRLDAFPLQTSEGYYCAKEECQEVGNKENRGRPKKVTKPRLPKKSPKPICGLCGERRKKIKVIKTQCCNNWICNDEHTYRPLSFGFDSCLRTHKRYTLCAFHFTEGHEGRWQDCKMCDNEFDDDYYATNSFNFEKLEKPKKKSIPGVNCTVTAETSDSFNFENPEKNSITGVNRSATAVTSDSLNFEKLENPEKNSVTSDNSTATADTSDVLTLYTSDIALPRKKARKLEKLENPEKNSITSVNCTATADTSDSFNFERLENPDKNSVTSGNCTATADTSDVLILYTSDRKKARKQTLISNFFKSKDPKH